MAEIVLGMGSSHAGFGGPKRWAESAKRDMTNAHGGGMPMNLDIPQMVEQRKDWIGKELTPEAWERRYTACTEAVATLGKVFAETAPDVVVVIGDDTHEVFMPEEHIPAVDVFWGDTVRWVPRAGRTPTPEPLRELPGKPELGEQLISSLIDEGFDISHTREFPQDRTIGHAFDFVYSNIMQKRVPPHVPIWLNTYYFPNVPTLKRCYSLGKALGRAIQSWDSNQRVAVIGSGGFSHLVIDETLDREVLAALQDKDEQHLAGLPEEPFIFGTSEIRNWLVMAGAMHDTEASMNLVCYAPCYRTPAGTGCAATFGYWN